MTPFPDLREVESPSETARTELMLGALTDWSADGLPCNARFYGEESGYKFVRQFLWWEATGPYNENLHKELKSLYTTEKVETRKIKDTLRIRFKDKDCFSWAVWVVKSNLHKFTVHTMNSFGR